MLKTFLRAISFCLIITIICSFIYPLFITIISQKLFSYQANGSMIKYQNKVVGSKLIGQNLQDNGYFQGRVSAVNYNIFKDNNIPKNLVASGSSNLGPSNPKLVKRLIKHNKAFIKAHPYLSKKNLPLELLSCSASGLDPHISLESATVQITTVAKYSGLKPTTIKKIIKNATEQRSFGVFGEPCINITLANIAIFKKSHSLKN